jgi:hypothetical protein
MPIELAEAGGATPRRRAPAATAVASQRTADRAIGRRIVAGWREGFLMVISLP